MQFIIILQDDDGADWHWHATDEAGAIVAYGAGFHTTASEAMMDAGRILADMLAQREGN